MGEVGHGPHPGERRRDRQHVLERAEVAHAAHHLDAEGHGAALRLEPLAQQAELLDDRGDRLLVRPPEQEAGMEDDRLGPARGGDAGRVVEHPDRHVVLLAELGVAHEAGERRVQREGDPGVPGRLAEPLGPRVVHPEAAREVDLDRGVAALDENRDGFLGAFARGNAGRAEAKRAMCATLAHGPSDRCSYAFHMAQRPSRIELLELDIDLRLTDLWREAGEVGEWSLEVVAAFMRAAYGKGYCDALTEDAPGSLCHDHGYRIPRGGAPAPSRQSRAQRPSWAMKRRRLCIAGVDTSARAERVDAAG